MKKLAKIALLTAGVALFGCSHTGMQKDPEANRDPASAGDGYRSSIDDIDLGVIYQPPANVSPIICKKMELDPRTGAEDLNAYKACQQGVGAARYMAERYSQNEGKYLGCVDGLQQGLRTGYLMGKDPSAEQLEEARKRYTSAKMESAITRATSQAKRDGASIADGEIISRFRAVVGTNQEPNGDYQYPNHSFSGYDDGYVNDARGGSFDEVYELGWVPRGTRDFRAIEARAVYKLHRDTYTPEKLCRPVEVTFSDTSMLSLWDYFAARGQYNFEKYGWRDTNRSLNYFLNRVSGTPEILFYNAIEGRTMQEKYEVEVQPARREGIPGTELIVTGPDGKPQIQRDENGNIMYGQYKDIPAVYETRYRTVPVPGRDKAYYQGLYREAFAEAYRDYYITQYFGLGFVSSHKSNTTVGELVGQLIGKQVAADYADFIAYNNKYREDSIGAYNLEWKSNYDRQWKRIWTLFSEHAMIEINEMSLLGDRDDEIFQAGEKIRALLTLTNLGRRSEAITTSMYGDLVMPAPVHVKPAREVPISAMFPIDTNFLSQLDPQLSSRERASVGVRVRGAVEYDTSLVTEKAKSILINSVAEIDGLQASLNEMNGTGGVQVRLVNPAKAESASMITLRVVLAGNLGEFKQETLKMGPKETRLVNVMFSGVDPFDIMERGGISGAVQSIMNGQVLHQREFSVSASPRYISLAKYFSGLASGASVATGDDDRLGRLQETMGMIQQMTQEDIRRGVDWEEQNQLENTVVGQLGRQYLSAKAAGKLSQEAQRYYNELGKNLNTLEIGRFKRKAYRKALNIFAPDVKVKKK